MDYHPFELIKLVSAHTRIRRGIIGISGGRPEWLLAQVIMPPPPVPPSVSVHSTSLSLAFALQGFFPQQIVLLSLQRVAITQPLFTSPQAITIRQFPPPPCGQYS